MNSLLSWARWARGLQNWGWPWRLRVAGVDGLLWNLCCPACLYWLGRYECREQGQTWQLGGTAGRQDRSLQMSERRMVRGEVRHTAWVRPSGPQQVRVENILSPTLHVSSHDLFIIILLFLYVFLEYLCGINTQSLNLCILSQELWMAGYSFPPTEDGSCPFLCLSHLHHLPSPKLLLEYCQDWSLQFEWVENAFSCFACRL